MRSGRGLRDELRSGPRAAGGALRRPERRIGSAMAERFRGTGLATPLPELRGEQARPARFVRQASSTAVAPGASRPCGCIDKVNTPAQTLGMDVRYEYGGESFVWDANKAQSNLRKHGVRFEDVATVFLDPLFKLIDASRNDEARDAAIGFDLCGRLLYVVHIEIEGAYLRIVSARPATPEEELFYAE